MKSRVTLSPFSSFLTVLVCGLLLWGLIATYGSSKFVILAVVTIVLVGAGLLYAPMSVDVDPAGVRLNSPVRTTLLPLDRISSVELFQPTMDAIRVFGSGGFMGYWGLFREGDTGPYTASYGRASDCFMITMADGKKIVAGCRNPRIIVDEIRRLQGS